MSTEQRETMRALLPGLHYLAAEALRSGCHDVSKIIFDAISNIEHCMHDDTAMERYTLALGGKQ